MTDSAGNVHSLESEYLSGMTKQFNLAKGKILRGSVWKLARQDEADRLRSIMAQHKKFDRKLLADTPKNRRIVLHSYKRPWWWFGKKRIGVAIASVISPLEWHVLEGHTGEKPPPIGSRELLDHVRSLQVDPRVDHVIGVCSPSGFTPDALEARPEYGNVTLVLVEPGDHGGWRVVGSCGPAGQQVVKLFDPEDTGGKAKRVAKYLEQRSAALLTGGLSVSQIAGELSLPEKAVSEGFERYAKKDPELHVGRHDGEVLIYRGAATETQEKASMSMVDRIRQLFSRDGDEVKKINELSKRRAALSQRRDRMYDEIAQLETREGDLMSQGKQNKSQVVRRRIAAQVAQLRKDIQRQNATANMLNQQINILSTDIHNLTLIQQGETASLPSTEQLTENAVKAEEMLEGLTADADLVGSLDTGITEMLTSDEELAILEEFEEPAETTAAQPQADTRAAPSGETESSPQKATGEEKESRGTEPEAS